MKNLIRAVTVLAVSTAQADTLYVDVDCPGPGNGSEAEPYCSIQAAIEIAVDTDVIAVARGTYFETIKFIGKAIWLHSSSGPEVTIIDGQQIGTVVTFNSGEGPDTVLEGFTIRGGTGSLFEETPNVFLDVGGGMLNDHSNPTVADCTFAGNTVIGTDSGGGGMYNFHSNPTVTNCTFAGNTVTGTGSRGGGMYNFHSSPTVTNCTFEGNEVIGLESRGGGMFNHFDDSSPTVTNCTFSRNSAQAGGGLYIGDGGTVANCTFIANSAALHGGGIFNNANSHPTLTSCMLVENKAGNEGGGLLNAGNITVTNYMFNSNTAKGNSGGVSNRILSSPTVTNCTFSRNLAQAGGGVFTRDNTTLTVTNCTFSGNTATKGHALAFDSFLQNGPSNLIMTNCILWGDIWNNDGSTLNINYSDVAGGFRGIGNIDADPLFVDPANGDTRLLPGSPCIDAGDNTAVPQDITTDLDGNARFVDDPDTIDTGNGDPPVVDMGASEFQGASPCPWDCDGGESTDGTVGIVDFLTLLAQWGGPGSGDFDGGGVGINDFLELLGNWGPCP